MGRAGRPKNGVPPGLEELEGHGVPEGWHRYWHGDQNQVTSHRELPSSPLFPGVEIPEGIGQEPLSSKERIALLAQMRVEDGQWPPDDDPVLLQLWESEWLRVQGQSWTRNYSSEHAQERLRGVWMHGLIYNLAWNGQSALDDAKDCYWWRSEEEARERIAARATSALAAALVDGGATVEEDLQKTLRILRTDADPMTHNEWVRENIIPEGNYLTSAVPDLSEDYFREAWKSLQMVYSYKQNPSHIEKPHKKLVRILEKGRGPAEEFAATPLASSDGKLGLHEAAFSSFAWWRDDRKEVMNSIAEGLLRRQISRIYWEGHELPKCSHKKRAEWKRYISGESSTNPLESLRPLFRGEDNEEELDELISYIEGRRTKISREPSIEDAFFHFFEVSKIHGFYSREIARSIRQYFAPNSNIWSSFA